MAKIAIVFHSGYGHTAKVAEHVRKGAAINGAEVRLYKAEDLTTPDKGPWAELAEAGAIIFGAPTYMGSVSAGMKQFIDASSKVWMSRAWENKLAAGFTNSGSLSGDKQVSLQQLATFAAQQGMIWVGNTVPTGYNASGHDFETATNRAGFFLGLGTQSLVDLPAETTPNDSDLKTAELFGRRIAEATLRWARTPAEPALA